MSTLASVLDQSPPELVVVVIFLAVAVAALARVALFVADAVVRLQDHTIEFKQRRVREREAFEDELRRIHRRRAEEDEHWTEGPRDERPTSAVGRGRDRSSSERLLEATRAGTTFQDLGEALADLQAIAAAQELGEATELVKLARYMPVTIYVEGNDPEEFLALRDALEDFLERFDFDISSETRLERGSWFQKLTARFRKPSTQEELRHQARVAQQAIHNQVYGLPQADINVKQAEAAERLNNILLQHDDFTISFGSLVGVTHRNPDGTRTSAIVELTPDEVHLLQRRGGALQDARKIYESLQSMRPEAFATSTGPPDGDPPRQISPPTEPENKPRELPPGEDAA